MRRKNWMKAWERANLLEIQSETDMASGLWLFSIPFQADTTSQGVEENGIRMHFHWPEDKPETKGCVGRSIYRIATEQAVVSGNSFEVKYARLSPSLHTQLKLVRLYKFKQIIAPILVTIILPSPNFLC
jgi:hypothetical protein